jgi:septum formation protein
MPPQSHKRKLILASSSPYRKLLLERLGIPFLTASPNADETPQKGEPAEQLVTRLAKAKAKALAAGAPSSVVIGSDQLAVGPGGIAGKPGTPGNAIAQLQAFSGHSVQFLTAVCVMCRETGLCHEETVVTEVLFRRLSESEIRRYIERDKPLDCAGSFKSEATGISLLQSMISSDPTAIVGLPLITLSEGLRRAGYPVP